MKTQYIIILVITLFSINLYSQEKIESSLKEADKTTTKVPDNEKNKQFASSRLKDNKKIIKSEKTKDKRTRKGYYLSQKEDESETGSEKKSSNAHQNGDPRLYYIITIKDNKTSEPLRDAKINMEGRPFPFFTDENGTFRFRAKPGKYMIVVTHPRYIKFSGTIEIKKDKETKTTFKVHRSAKGLDVILVTATRIKHAVSKSKVTQGEIRTIPGARNDPVRAMVTSIPGVMMQSSAMAGQFVVRGGEPQDNVIYFDNLLTVFPFHFGGLLSVFHAQSVESVDFYTAAFPPGYGPYFGSVMDIKSTRFAKKELSAHLDINMLYASGFIEGPIGDDWYFMFGARRSYFEVMASILPDFETVPYFWDYFFKMSYKFDEYNQIDFLAFGSQDGMKLEVEEDTFGEENEDQIDPQMLGTMSMDMNFFTQGFNWYYRPNNKFNSVMTLGYTIQKFDMQMGKSAQTGKPFYIKSTNNFFSFREQLMYSLSKDLQLYGGIFMVYYHSPFEISMPRPPQEGETITSFNDLGEVVDMKITADGYVHDNYIGVIKDWDNLKVNFGLDWHYYNIIKKHSFSPKIIPQYTLTEHWLLTGGIGFYPQFPDPSETFRPFGTPELDYQESWHYVLGAQFSPTKLWEFKLETYYKSFGELVVTNEAYPFQSSEPLLNRGTGKSYGLEANIKRKFSDGLYSWVNYTLAFAKRDDHNGTGERYSQYDQRHMVNFIFSWRFDESWRFGAKWRLSTGTPYTPVIGRYPSLDENGQPNLDSNGNQIWMPIYASDPLTERLPTRHQLDLRISWLFNIIGKKDGTIYLEFLNAYMTKNVIGYAYDYDYGNYENPDEQGDLPFIPYIGFEWKF